MTVALTGGIGGGKSTVAQMFESLGAQVVSGDMLGRQVLEEDDEVKQELIKRIGRDAFDSNGRPNRSLIASRVFANVELSNWLTELTFPGIYARWQSCKNSAIVSVVVFDAALIFEWKIQDEFDLVVTVATSHRLAYDRSAKRFSLEDFEKRSKAQIPIQEKIARADLVVYNDESLERLEDQVKTIWKSNILPLLP